LDLSVGLFKILAPFDYTSEDGTDCRNYGGLDGIPEMKRLFAELMEMKPEEIFVGGNASLTLMYEALIEFCTRGAGKRKFLCPAPGYDRHFTMTEYLGFELIPIKMNATGPDMDEVRKWVADPSVAGIWCVPLFSNPQGIVYSDEVVREFASLKPAAADFRIFWDNAYMVHGFNRDAPGILNILRECEMSGAEDMVLVFSSFSKISFPGAGVCAMAASAANLKRMREHMIVQSIGPDKLNQLRHVRYFKNAAGVWAHMDKISAILRPKFAAVLDTLEARLGGKGVGTWLRPQGGYFVAFDTLPGRAKRTVELCAEKGLILTEAGATYPYGRDPHDSNIRLAPTFPPLGQLEQAMEIFCWAVELAAKEGDKRGSS